MRDPESRLERGALAGEHRPDPVRRRATADFATRARAAAATRSRGTAVARARAAVATFGRAAAISRTKAAIATLAAGALLACSRENPAPLFEGAPSFDLVPEAAIREAFGAPPPARFARLRYERRVFGETTEPGGRVLHEREVRTLDAAGGLTRSRVESTVPRDDGEYVDEEVGVLGLAVFASRMTKRIPGLTAQKKEIRFLSHVTAVTKSRGRLFPLAVGNRLEIELESLYQSSDDGRRTTPARLRFVYEYEVVKEEEGFATEAREIPGKLFVIHVRESGPEGTDEVERHFSVSLGAVVLERRTGPGLRDETRLVGWTDEAGDEAISTRRSWSAATALVSRSSLRPAGSAARRSKGRSRQGKIRQ